MITAAATRDDASRQQAGVQREASRVRTRKATQVYEAQLRKIAVATGNLTRQLYRGEHTVEEVQSLLGSYADLLTPWATRTATRMIQGVDDAAARTWFTLSADMGFALRQELRNAPTGHWIRALVREQVENIKSIPLQASYRLGKLATQGLYSGMRQAELAAKILETEDVSKARATMLARTALSVAASSLVQARAEVIGSPGYVWETAKDGTVRESHRRMQGKFVRWDTPPTIDKYTAHAGCYANDRCWPRPVFDLE